MMLTEMNKEKDGVELQIGGVIMKTIIALWGSANRGKTETITFLIKELITLGAEKIWIPVPISSGNTDYLCVLKYSGKTIAITTKGDDKASIFNDEEKLRKSGSYDVFICACRTRGQSWAAVKDLAKGNRLICVGKNSLTVDPSSSVRYLKELQEQMNRLQAKQLVAAINYAVNN